MRVTSASSRTAGGNRRVGRGDKGGFTVASKTDGVAAAPAGSLGVLTSVDALGVLQGLDVVGEASAGTAERLVARGETLLDELANLRDGLLRGAVDRNGLERLRRSLAERRPTATDTRLEAVLDDIELRVAVELAKADGARAPQATPEPPSLRPPDVPLSPSELACRARQAYGGQRR